MLERHLHVYAHKYLHGSTRDSPRVSPYFPARKRAATLVVIDDDDSDREEGGQRDRRPHAGDPEDLLGRLMSSCALDDEDGVEIDAGDDAGDAAAMQQASQPSPDALQPKPLLLYTLNKY